MKTIVFPAVSLAIAITIISFASSAAQDPNGRRPGIDEAAAVEQANKQIDVVYKELMNKLDVEGQKSLREAQRSWIKWRDDEALLIARVGGAIGGSALRADFLTAQASLIRERTAVLKAYLDRSGNN
jgi:uncharacterized protein YecT (DUF1311 family)